MDCDDEHREVVGRELLEGNQIPGSVPPQAGPWPLLWYRMVRGEALSRLTVIGNTAVANSGRSSHSSSSSNSSSSSGGSQAEEEAAARQLLNDAARVDAEQLPALRSEMAQALGALLPGLAMTQESLAVEFCDLIAGTTIWLMSGMMRLDCWHHHLADVRYDET
jgi:hypothetical protein